MSPFEVLYDLICTALCIIQDEDLVAAFDEALPRSQRGETMMGGATQEPSACPFASLVHSTGLPTIGVIEGGTGTVFQ